MSNLVKKCFEAVGLGKFANNSHPIHPATVHFPLAFLTLANVLSLLYGSVLYLPNNPILTRDQSSPSALSILAYATNLLGIITSVPAILTGGAELYAMIKGNGLYQKDEKGQQKLVPKVKVALMHAGLNDLVIAGAVFNWLQQRNAPDFRPAGYQVLVNAVLTAIQMYAAYLGGDLVYTHGVGVQRMGEGAKKKQQ
ncbi:hypothetical protein EG329_004646 [Mollisiaceae sp. DMI_Dod_QoI]|nr:hypothetical protein EG329_004646 [Helotiales sp. DMI_Dod_QoI]